MTDELLTEIPPGDEVVELLRLYRDDDGSIKGEVRLASGLVAVRTAKTVSIEATVHRADGSPDEEKGVVAVSASNPITEQRLREEHEAGEVRFG